MAGVTEVQFDDALTRCMIWDGDMNELKLLGEIIEGTYENDHLFEVSCMAEQLLLEDQLPSFYRAKMYAFLSSCEEYDSMDCILNAASYLEDAKADFTLLGWMPEEIVEWEEIIATQKRQIVDYEFAIAIRPLPARKTREPSPPSPQGSSKWVQAISGTEEVDTEEPIPASALGSTSRSMNPSHTIGSVKKNKNRNKNKNRRLKEKQTKENLRIVAQEQEASTFRQTEESIGPDQEEATSQSIKEQKVRQDMAKIPKSMRMKLSVANHISGEGSVGALKQSKLRPPPSMTTFDLFRSEHDRKEGQKGEAAKEDQNTTENKTMKEGDKEEGQN